jgi:hypothetical protein
MAKYRDIITSLEKSIEDLKQRGITVDALNHAKDELVAHTDNIEKIEMNIDAVRKEVISPIKEELNQNRVAGKFSILGFWVGAVSMIVSILVGVINYSPIFKGLTKASGTTSIDIVDGNKILPQMIFNSHKYNVVNSLMLVTKASEINGKPVVMNDISITNLYDKYDPSSGERWLKISIVDSTGKYNRIYVLRDSPLADFIIAQEASVNAIYGIVNNKQEEGALILDGIKLRENNASAGAGIAKSKPTANK